MNSLTIQFYNELSERFLSLNNDEKLKIINIGEHIYFNGLKLYNSTEIDKEIFATNQRLDEIRLQHEEKLKKHTEFVREQYASIASSQQDLIDSKQNEIDELKERINKLEDENCQALSLSGKLDSLMGKGNTVDNAMKGDFGESIVGNQIQYWYQTSEIEDKSAETASGDLLWKIKDFKALVEVKNVQIVRPSEIQKFERDISVNTKDSTCNCGLFVSLKTETIPGKGKFKLEFLNECPVIYVSNILNDLQTLRFALDSLYIIQTKLKHVSTHSDNEQEDFENNIIEYIQSLYNKLMSMTTNITQMKQSVETLNVCIMHEENSLKDIVSNLIELRSTNDVLKNIEFEYKSNNKQDIKESILRDMRLYKEQHGRIPTMSELIETGKYKLSTFREDLAYKKLKTQI